MNLSTHIFEPASWASCLTGLLASMYSIIAVYSIECFTTMRTHVFTRKGDLSNSLLTCVVRTNTCRRMASLPVSILRLQRHLLIWNSIKWYNVHINILRSQFLCFVFLYEWHHTFLVWKPYVQQQSQQWVGMAHIHTRMVTTFILSAHGYHYCELIYHWSSPGSKNIFIWHAHEFILQCKSQFNYIISFKWI